MNEKQLDKLIRLAKDLSYIVNKYQKYMKPREAYASLIDKVSGKGTWDSNPYVFVYDFELVK